VPLIDRRQRRGGGSRVALEGVEVTLPHGKVQLEAPQAAHKCWIAFMTRLAGTEKGSTVVSKQEVNKEVKEASYDTKGGGRDIR